MRTRTLILVVLTAGILFPSSDACAAPFLPDFSAATFLRGGRVDNPYFPIIDGLTLVYKGQRQEGNATITERNEVTNVGLGPKILGVRTAKQLDRVFENGRLVERTLDYYAQDTVGNVWYFGEDTTEYVYDSMGNLTGTNHDGSWRAGVNGAKPGFIMPVDKTVGFNYYQEFAPNDSAVDEATTFATNLKLGRYKNVLKVLEATALDPDNRSFKYYAPGVGLIRTEEGVSADLKSFDFALKLMRIIDSNENDRRLDGATTSALTTADIRAAAGAAPQGLRLLGAAIPEPSSALLTVSGIVATFWLSRRRASAVAINYVTGR